MELKFGVATILYKYSDLTKFDKNLEGSRFIFRWNDPHAFCGNSLGIPLGKSHLLLDAVIVLPVWSIRAGIVLPTDQSDCSMPPSHVINCNIYQGMDNGCFVTAARSLLSVEVTEKLKSC